MLCRALSVLCLPLAPRHATTRCTCPLSWSEQEHLQELKEGTSLFPLFPPATASARPTSDAPGRGLECGRTHSVGVGNAGPDEHVLAGGHLIHVTAESVLTRTSRSHRTVRTGYAYQPPA